MFRLNLVKLKENPGKVPEGKEITAKEYNDAWKIIIHMEQKERLSEKDVLRLVPKKINIKLNNYKSIFQHVVLGGRVPNFPQGFSTNGKLDLDMCKNMCISRERGRESSI